MRRLATTTVAALALAMALPAVPTHAETGAVADGLGVDLPANTDVTGLRVRNGETTVGLRVRFADLDPDRRARVKILVDPAPKDATQYIVESVKRPGRTGETWLLLALGMEFDGTPVACDGITGAWDVERDRVDVRVPQSCMPEQGRVAKFRASTVHGQRAGDWTDFLRVRKGSSTVGA